MSDPTYQDVLDTRTQEEFIFYARVWMEAQRTEKPPNSHDLNLFAWSSGNPVQALAIILNLLDFSEDEADMVQEMIALGPVEWIVERSPESFAPVLRQAVREHPRFALFTKWKRENSEREEWLKLREVP